RTAPIASAHAAASSVSTPFRSRGWKWNAAAPAAAQRRASAASSAAVNGRARCSLREREPVRHALITALDSDGAAVDPHVLPGHPMAGVAGEEGDDGRDLLGTAEPAEGGHRLEAGEKLGTLAVAVGLGFGRAGRDDVDADPPLAEVLGDDVAHRFD